MKRLVDTLTRSRQLRFVGRAAEIDLFRTALAVAEPPFVVLHIYGPGGVGKTTLLHEYARLAAACGRPVLQLDGRQLEPTPAALEMAVQPIASKCRKPVLLLDTYETLAGIDSWVRATFLGQLPADMLVVIAGRHVPSAWLSDNGWADLTRIISLGNLQPDESQRYLAARGVPAERHPDALAFTHGHPLALALIAELYRQRPDQAPTAVTDERGVLQILVEQFLRDVPTDAHRHALELCALARTTTEALLACRVGTEQAFPLFRWLRQLAFIETGPCGVYPHDLLRDVVEADLHWRNPGAYHVLRQVAMRYALQQLEQSSGVERQRLRLDVLFLNRRDPGLRPFFVWDALDTAIATPATPADVPAILEMVRQHEGDQSAEIARYWLQCQPEAFLVYCTPMGELYGFMAQLTLQEAMADDTAVDPAVSAALRYVESLRPLRSGEALSYLRFWMARDTYQAVSMAINLTAANCVIHWTSTPRLAWSFLAMANPDFMAPHFASIRCPRTPAADFMVGGRTFGVFSHDWMADPLHRWLADTRHGDVSVPGHIPGAPPLTASEFAAAVRRALVDYTRVDRLATNPLCGNPLLSSASHGPEALQVALRQAVEMLNHNPKDAKLYRALWYTYIEPEPSQEKAAERLGLPFNTYRYHLSTGLARVTGVLWHRSQAQSV